MKKIIVNNNFSSNTNAIRINLLRSFKAPTVSRVNYYCPVTNYSFDCTLGDMTTSQKFVPVYVCLHPRSDLKKISIKHHMRDRWTCKITLPIPGEKVQNTSTWAGKKVRRILSGTQWKGKRKLPGTGEEVKRTLPRSCPRVERTSPGSYPRVKTARRKSLFLTKSWFIEW